MSAAAVMLLGDFALTSGIQAKVNLDRNPKRLAVIRSGENEYLVQLPGWEL